MKRITFVIFTLIFLIATPIVSAEVINTKSSRTGDFVVVEENEVIDRDYFTTGDTVEIYGTINGDLYAAGGQVTIAGTVNGDVLVAGGMLEISGTVSQDVRAAGGQITISGEVGRNISVAGGNISTTSSATIGGSVAAAGGNINLNAPVQGNVNIAGGSATIANSVGGDIEATIGQLRLTSKADVGGDVEYWSEEEAFVSEGATVAGTIKKSSPKALQPDKEEIESAAKGIKGVFKEASYAAKVFGFLTTLALGIIIIYLFPNYSTKTLNTLTTKSFKSLGVGFLSLVALPIVFIITLFTVIGIPFVLIGFALYGIHIYISKVFVILWGGKFLAKKIGQETQLTWAFVLGLIVYTVLISIPVLNIFVKLSTLLFGFGAVLITCKDLYTEARKKGIY